MNDLTKVSPRLSSRPRLSSARRPDVLSDREVQILTLVADGRTNKQIGTALYLSAATVHSHLKNVFRKLDANDRAHAVAKAFRAGMLS